jgi:C-terminal processing protease CtpA/Prc
MILKRPWRTPLPRGAKGLILDLRDNPGGIMDQAVDVASQLLVRGTVVKIMDKDGLETVQKVIPRRENQCFSRILTRF